MNRSKKIRTLAALGTLSGAAWAGTFASFTDEATSAATFSAGTVDLRLDEDSDDVHSSALSVSNLKPGDEKFAGLALHNPGSLHFTYGMRAATVDTVVSPAKPGLGAALRVSIAKIDSAATCNSTTFAAGQSVVAESPFATAAFSARALAPTAQEQLCFRVNFPNGTPEADNPLQGAATTATFTFTATQSASPAA